MYLRMVGFGLASSSDSPSTTGGSNTRPERPSDLTPMMPEKITWPMVALVTVILAAVVGLSIAHVDTVVITNILMALGLGGGLGLLHGIRSNVNGNLQKLVDLLGAAMDKLSQSTPPDATPPDGKEPHV